MLFLSLHFNLCSPDVPLFCVQEYKRKQIEEQRQAERLQRQLQQERAYLVSLQQQQEPPRPPQDKKQLYHYKDQAPSSNDKPTWAKEVACRAGDAQFHTTSLTFISLILVLVHASEGGGGPKVI